MVVRWHGQTVVDIPVDPVAANAPMYERPQAVPADLAARQKLDLASIEPESDLQGALLALLDSPNLGYTRPTNNAGGLEAGMTNGQPLVVRAAKKPISTLRKPLASINLATKEPEGAEYERSDVCAVPAAGVILENVVAFEVAAALIEKFGGDSLVEMKARYELFLKMARQR